MFNDLIGKTIAKATRYKLTKFDDEPILKLEFTDGTHCCVLATYGGYTGDSEDEYPAFIGRKDDAGDMTPIDEPNDQDQATLGHNHERHSPASNT